MHPIVHLAKQIAVSNVSDLKIPYKLTYVLTYRCQFNCSMCNIGAKKPQQELEVGEISEIFQRSNRFSWVNLSGGEIFLRTDVPDIIRAIAKPSPDLYLLNFPTNGYQTEIIVDSVREIIRTLRIPKIMVTVSLDGPQSLHDRIRNMPGSWNRAIETFRCLRKLKNGHLGVYFGMTLQDANADAYEDTVCSVRKHIKDIRHEDFHVNVLHTSSHYYANTECGGIHDKQHVLAGLGSIMQHRKQAIFSPVSHLERRYQSMAKHYLQTGRSPVSCQALSSSLFMDPSGTVYPCTIFDSPTGNIRDFGYDLMGLWKSAERHSLRQEILKGNCPQCWTPCEAYQSILANIVPGFRRN